MCLNWRGDLRNWMDKYLREKCEESECVWSKVC